MTEKEIKDLLLYKSYHFLSRRPRSKKEMLDYLSRKIKRFEKSVNSDLIIEKIINQLEEDGQIDDQRFVKWWVDERTYFKPRGARALRSELAAKGVKKDIVDIVFEEEPLDEATLAKKLLNSRLPRFLKFDKRQQLEKASRFLMSKGFSFSTAKKAFEELTTIE